MAIDFSTIWPYSEIKPVTVDGQAMVRIPRIYVKNGLLESGTHKGRLAYFISKEPLDGYHVHPAFIMKGGIPASAVDIGVYEASKDATSNKAASVKTTSFWQNINRANAITACSKRNVEGGNDEQKNWRCFNIYDYALLARLKLIEMGKTDGEAVSGTGGSGTTTVYETYHGIENPFGNPTSPCWLPGIGNIGDTIRLYKNDGSEEMIDTGLKAAGNGWVTNFAIDKGGGFDLGDVFVASAITTTKKDGICSDWQRLNRNGVTETGYITGYLGAWTNDPAGAHGMFAISQETYSGHSGYGSPSAIWGGYYYGCGPLRFRLAHFVA
ncbi:MAG: hypothetical protein PUE51_07690 [Veillonellaceae bacterium]|nr:hypothetical protein [Veillonellaceae bacterium]